MHQAHSIQLSADKTALEGVVTAAANRLEVSWLPCFTSSSFRVPFVISVLLSPLWTQLTHSLTHSLAHPLTHSLTHSLTHPLTRSPTHSLARSPTHSLTHSLTHLLTYPLTRSPTHPLTCSPTHSLFCPLHVMSLVGWPKHATFFFCFPLPQDDHRQLNSTSNSQKSCLQAGEPPTEDVEKDWQRLERDRSQLWDMKRQVMLATVIAIT